MDGKYARYESYWLVIWKQLKKHRLSYAALFVVLGFCLTGIYAPFLASSKPLFVVFDGEPYFPLFRYLFYIEFYTKFLDIFFNLTMFTIPLALLAGWLFKNIPKAKYIALTSVLALQFILFLFIIDSTPRDPAADPQLAREYHEALKNSPLPDWNFDLKYMSPYAKLNLILAYVLEKRENERLVEEVSSRTGIPKAKVPPLPTLWQLGRASEDDLISAEKEIMRREEAQGKTDTREYRYAKAKMQYIIEKRDWIEGQSRNLHYLAMPLIRPFHWEDDAGGDASLNEKIDWWDVTRTNGKDLVAALIFGVRISIVVGLLAVGLALAIGIPIGALAGFYGGVIDIVVCRMLEIWESMPTFFMLLMVVAITQTKSIFLVIAVIGIFGWTGFSRYIRGEFFKQRNLPYVEACYSMGYRDPYIIFSHILPNAIPPVLTLLPFAIMGAITSEAGLSFLGLGEEESCSWGVLMDEGRSAFPGQSYLLWPPAILLTVLLVAIALVGDGLRDAIDPKAQI